MPAPRSTSAAEPGRSPPRSPPAGSPSPRWNSTPAAAGVLFRRADVLVDDLGGPYDFVSCLAALHHLPLEPGLRRLRSLVRPGGVLAVLGLAREEGLLDRAASLASVPLDLAARLVRDDPVHAAPVTGPEQSLREVRAVADRVVPGARFRRRLFWRYSMIWRRPSADTFPDRISL
ncbi:SAM-dependent methyltransferase [Saccharothrix yanglingensis]|uniref:SAM-dependent methyltransferase n=1 Tax=Saccharothrix yanglingensis TaxID=659496 RepID=UPI0027D2ACFF|nr:SAM-dependent methyltransferase [Saccharothrix yanglingensis]